MALGLAETVDFRILVYNRALWRVENHSYHPQVRTLASPTCRRPLRSRPEGLGDKASRFACGEGGAGLAWPRPLSMLLLRARASARYRRIHDRSDSPWCHNLAIHRSQLRADPIGAEATPAKQRPGPGNRRRRW